MPGETGGGAAGGAAFISVEAVSKRFPKTDFNDAAVLALDNLSIGFRKGQFVSIVGPSGCGKSTLLSLVAGLAPHFAPEQGRVVLDGRKIEGPGAERGMVFQEYAVFPWLTVRQNIEYPLRIARIAASERHARSSYYIEIMKLQGFENAYPYQLSGGMKQRVAVARALVGKPKVLLMDEPFAAVDAQTRLTMQEELLRVWEREQITVLFVTHSVQEAVFLADRVVAMTGRPGQIRADIEVGLPRPRIWREVDRSETFLTLQHRITELIMQHETAS